MRGRPGGARYYANAIERLDPEKGADPVDVTIELERGAKIAGQLVNEAGEPIDEALMITRLNIVPTTLSWRGDASKHVLGGRFDLSPLEPGVKYTVHFLDAKQRLGATVTLSTDDADANRRAQTVRPGDRPICRRGWRADGRYPPRVTHGGHSGRQ